MPAKGILKIESALAAEGNIVSVPKENTPIGMYSTSSDKWFVVEWLFGKISEADDDDDDDDDDDAGEKVAKGVRVVVVVVVVVKGVEAEDDDDEEEEEDDDDEGVEKEEDRAIFTEI